MTTKRPHVMVVGDDEELTTLAGRLLELEGYQVIQAREGGAALALLEKEHTDLVILDVGVPTLKGIETCLYLRRQSRVPIIMLSTWGTGPDKFRSLEFGEYASLTEPRSIERLAEWIEQTLARNQAPGGPRPRKRKREGRERVYEKN